MLPIKKIEDFVIKETKEVESVIHDFSHLKRTAVGAVWFVKILGGSKEEENMAYVAGLLHDIVRPATEEICHAKASAEKSEEMLKDFGVKGETLRRIIEAIADHRKPVKWKDALHQSIFLADKIFEQMGAFVCFRRCMYIGEMEECKGKTAKEVIEPYLKKRIQRFGLDDFPKQFQKLIKYQFKWIVDFTDSYKDGNSLALHCFNDGRAKKNLEDTIRNFVPKNKEDGKIHREAVSYIDGKLFGKFSELVN